MASHPEDLTAEPLTQGSPADDEVTRLGADWTPTSAPAGTPGEGRTGLRLDLAPGSIVAGRYRLVALLGRGGMGEVHRADDLTLGQPVALKFLPAGQSMDAHRLEHFHNELRVARQVSHKNVCRLYDLGETNGRRFLTMEYVDGEDLASLLRRIGRIPQDKAIEIARQLCAGVSAAHERGVLHRDLKPANVMLDGEGQVRITDFGLAISAGDAKAVLAGTPQYMAPEQLKGAPATIQSDLYALGLILFEVFTGRRAHDAKSLDELRDFHESGEIKTPTSLVRDLAPAVEKIILRCLERDPSRRPRSALAVAAGLPGGDPIAEALAAGDTPSPDMLANAAETDALSPAKAGLMLGAFAAAVLLALAILPSMSLTGLAPVTKPPEVLIDRAELLLRAIGYSNDYGDRAFGMTTWGDYQTWLQRERKDDWKSIFRSASPAPMLFWYRTSPRTLSPSGTSVTQTDPPEIVPGMQTILFDAAGHLIQFRVVPPQSDAEATAAEQVPWPTLFEYAGLDQAAFAATTPKVVPSHYADARLAWEGRYPGDHNMPVTIEAASVAGHPTSFRVLFPWRQPGIPAATRSTARIVGELLSLFMMLALIAAAAIVARLHLVAGRADRRGARRLAILVLAGGAVVWLMGTHQNAIGVEVELFYKSMGFTLLLSGVCWVAYLALEPYARRYWPDGLLGWSRLLAGHVRDPRVGRDILRGLMFSALFIPFNLAYKATQIANADGARVGLFGDIVASLAHGPLIVEAWAATSIDILFGTLLGALLYIGMRAAFRRRWLAAIVTIGVMSLLTNSGAILAAGWMAPLMLLRTTLGVVVTVYGGLLTMLVASITSSVLLNVPMTANVGAWSATPSNVTLLAFVALGAFGYYAARGGQPLFGRLSAAPKS